MSSTGEQPATTRPSVFISYASQDRVPAKRLSAVFAEAGLDVWFDENELTGGDTWDQKIRRQLRECDFFVAIISAETEARKEGYFRREWRLAAERTIDMADDVMFLLPIVIDATREDSARVPDKFLSVQWLRCPDGEPTSALKAVAQRMARGAHDVPVRASRGGRRKDGQGPRIVEPLPAFPDNPGAHDRLKYYAHIVGWIFVFAWALFQRLPRVVRLALIGLLIIGASRTCTRDDTRPKLPLKSKAIAAAAHKMTAEEKAEAVKNVQALQERLKKSGINITGDIPNILNEALSSEADKRAHLLTLTPFDLSVTDEAAARLVRSIFGSVFVKLAGEPRASLGLNPKAISDGSDDALTLRSKELNTRFLGVPSLNGLTLTVRLFDAENEEKAWEGTYDLKAGDTETIAAKIAADLLSALPSR